MTVAVMITSAGRRVGLTKAVRDGAQAVGRKARIIATDLRPELSAACHEADVAYAVPRATDPNYASALLEICRKEDVRLVIPTIDHELMPMAMAQSRFADSGVHVNVASVDFVSMARDKLETANRLRAAGIQTPHTVKSIEGITDLPPDAPIIIKPRGGSSSIGIQTFATWRECAGITMADDAIAQELLRGPEYTVNVFFDRGGEFRTAIPHLRIETRGGEMSKGRTERRADMTDIARRIGRACHGVRGVFCFQVILTKIGPAVFEINARFGGGYPLAHHAGGRFTQWLVEESLGLDCSAHDAWTANVTALRYDMEAFC